MESKRCSTDSGIRQQRAEGDGSGEVRTNKTCDRDDDDDDDDDAVQWTESTVSQQAHQRLMRVMNGYVDSLPPLQSKIVRIFISSTFTGQPHVQPN